MELFISFKGQNSSFLDNKRRRGINYTRSWITLAWYHICFLLVFISSLSLCFLCCYAADLVLFLFPYILLCRGNLLVSKFTRMVVVVFLSFIFPVSESTCPLGLKKVWPLVEFELVSFSANEL